MAEARTGFIVLARQVQERVVTLIKARLVAMDEQVPCDLDFPKGGMRAEHVWIPSDFDAEIDHYTSGGMARRETSSVGVRLRVRRSNVGELTAADRAWQLAPAVEDAVSLDPTLGGLVKNAWVSSAMGAQKPDERDLEFGIAFVISYQAAARAVTG